MNREYQQVIQRNGSNMQSHVLNIVADSVVDVNTVKRLRSAAHPPSPLHVFVCGEAFQVDGIKVTYEKTFGKKDLPPSTTHAIYLSTYAEYDEFVRHIKGSTFYNIPSTSFLEDVMRKVHIFKQRAVNDRVKTMCFIRIPSASSPERDFILATIRYMESSFNCMALCGASHDDDIASILSWIKTNTVHL